MPLTDSEVKTLKEQNERLKPKVANAELQASRMRDAFNFAFTMLAHL